MSKPSRTAIVTLCVAAAVAAALSINRPASAKDPEPAGFRSLFNGKDLSGWVGDPRFWRVENGAIVGQTTADNPAPHNTFLIYRGGEFGDFDLRFSYKVSGFNSGIQYRSVELPDYVVQGYQADFEAPWHKPQGGGELFDQYSGMFFEEGGRMFMGQRGDVVIVRTDPNDSAKHVVEKIATTGDPAELTTSTHREGWNEYIVQARGYTFTHIINGRVMSIGYDEDVPRRRASGILAFQLHSGTPMRIDVKDLRIRPLN